MTGLALSALGVLAALGPADGPARPNRAQVQAAISDFLNAGCGPDCNHPFFAAVRNLRCTPQAGNRARCRFEERVEHFYERHPRWRRDEKSFVYDAAGGRWTMDCRMESAGANIQTIRCN